MGQPASDVIVSAQETCLYSPPAATCKAGFPLVPGVAAMPNPRPTELRLGFALWRIFWDRKELDKVRLAERDPHIQGYCDAARQVLVVEAGSPAAERVRLVHELLHACVATADNYAPAIATAELTEEELVRDAAPWLLEALVQNPNLLTWLTA